MAPKSKTNRNSTAGDRILKSLEAAMAKNNNGIIYPNNAAENKPQQKKSKKVKGGRPRLENSADWEYSFRRNRRSTLDLLLITPDPPFRLSEYIAVLDFEANCIPNEARNPEWYTPEKLKVFDHRTVANSFKNEIIEVPTVVLRRKRSEDDENTTENPNSNVDPETASVSTTTPVEENTGNNTENSNKKKSERWKKNSTNEDASDNEVDAGENERNLKANFETPEYEVVAEFRRFVKPQFCDIVLFLIIAITPFCTDLTGITQENVDLDETNPILSSGEDFSVVWRDWQKFMSNYPNALLVTCGDWDLKTGLPNQLNYSNLDLKANCIKQWCNVKFCYESLYEKKGRGMANMLNDLNIKLEGKHHSGIDDCRNIAKICTRLLKDGHDQGLDEQSIVYATSCSG